MLSETTNVGLAKKKKKEVVPRQEFLGQQVYRWKNLFNIELDKE